MFFLVHTEMSLSSQPLRNLGLTYSLAFSLLVKGILPGQTLRHFESPGHFAFVPVKRQRRHLPGCDVLVRALREFKPARIVHLKRPLMSNWADDAVFDFAALPVPLMVQNRFIIGLVLDPGFVPG